MSQFHYHTRLLPISVETETGASTGSIVNHVAGFICMQEVLHNQLYDILGSLNNIGESSIGTGAGRRLPEGPLWSHIGVAREDGKMKGEYSPILYPSQIFNLLHFENTWLSPTPDKPSKGWDAGSERILTSGVFEHKLSNRRLAVFNTHLDNAGTEAREKSVAIILSVIERIRSEWCRSTNTESSGASAEGLDYFLAGDFNSFPTQEAYKAMAESNKTVDVHEAVSARERYGSGNTFTGFEPDTDKDKDEIGRIDFVWLGPKQRVRDLNANVVESKGWHVQGYSVLPNVFDDGVFCSDHRCVVADAVLV
jgi:endonuclease/exonuclease/phosphatase family metal-dependent hydrolase